MGFASLHKSLMNGRSYRWLRRWSRSLGRIHGSGEGGPAGEVPEVLRVGPANERGVGVGYYLDWGWKPLDAGQRPVGLSTEGQNSLAYPTVYELHRAQFSNGAMQWASANSSAHSDRIFISNIQGCCLWIDKRGWRAHILSHRLAKNSPFCMRSTRQGCSRMHGRTFRDGESGLADTLLSTLLRLLRWRLNSITAVQAVVG